MTDSPAPRRLLWIVNHRTLMQAEVPILRELGWEVFVPKVLPLHHVAAFRSAGITHEYDAALRLPQHTLDLLNRHDFYEASWPPTIAGVVNRHFQAVVSVFFYRSLVEVVRKFQGRIIARAFGRESPLSYTGYITAGPPHDILNDLPALGDRFIFGQGYDNIAEIEAPELARRAHTITVPLPAEINERAGTWHGGGKEAVFLCPSIEPGGYYSRIHDGIKRDFGDLPHVIFGKQHRDIGDPTILPYLTDAELFALYARAPVFVYPHTEPRHVHYSPLEAMVVGTPTLYLRGALIDMLTGHADLPGACAGIAEMRDKAQRLLAGDRELANAIRATQGRALAPFSLELARSQWETALSVAGSHAVPGTTA